MSNDVEEYAKRNKKPIWGSFSISLLIHGGVLFLIGGIVVFKNI
jgi:preprotein translocase subunit Sss1